MRRNSDRVLYPTDEISAKRPARPARTVPIEALNAGPARFEAGPPAHWIRQFEGPHNMHVAPRWLSEDLVLVEGRYFQRPVPRLANCHFFVVDRDVRNVYFY